MPIQRRQHLLKGKRVQLRDLLRAELLSPGARIFLYRPLVGDKEEAIVDARGQIILKDGRSFKTLSRAASTIRGTQVDGWSYWTTEDGAPLDTLRQRLLALDAVGDESSSDGDDVRAKRHRFLTDAAAKCTNTPVKIPVRQLFELWGYTADTGENDRTVEADLANYGLQAEPPLFSINIDGVVTLISQTTLPEVREDLPEPDGQSEGGSSPQHEVADIKVNATTKVNRITIGTLSSSTSGLASINPQSSVEEAITTMSLNDYSQLAVMSSPRALLGAVSWRSIARARNVNPEAQLITATFTPHSFDVGEDLIPKLPTLLDHDFFIVRQPDNLYSGIVTAIDVVTAYQGLASPYLMLGEIDQRLRRIVEVNFDNDAIIEACDPNGNRKIESISQLTIGDYKHLLDHPNRWGELSWSLDRRIFCDRLDEIRALRNDIMHFNRSQSDSDNQTNRLRHFTELLREYDD